MATKRFMFGIGSPPFRFLAEHLAQDSDFLEDAGYLLKLDEGDYLRLSAKLAKTDEFLSRTELTSIVNETLGDNDNSDRIATIIHRMGGIVYDADMNVVEAMDALGKAIEEKAESLQPQDRLKLINRLRKLATEPVGISKQVKAQQLVNVIGAELEDARIICDIRPIFDQDHQSIDGAIPLSTLRLEYTEAHGESSVVEILVTEQQIMELGEKIADAKLKLELIKSLLKNQGVSIPSTKATISKGASDATL